MTERLDHLRHLGAAVFDPPAYRFIEGLLVRASGLSGAAATRLERRAEERAMALERAFLAARVEAEALLDALRSEGADPDGAFARSFEQGDLGRVLRDAPRALRLVRSDTVDAARARVGRLLGEADRRGATLPADLAAEARAVAGASGRLESGLEAAVRAVGDRLAQVLYREAAEHARATVVVARAHDRLSESFGLYNPQALAARALAALEATSPAFLRHYLAGLEDLAALRRLPEPRRR